MKGKEREEVNNSTKDYIIWWFLAVFKDQMMNLIGCQITCSEESSDV